MPFQTSIISFDICFPLQHSPGSSEMIRSLLSVALYAGAAIAQSTTTSSSSSTSTSCVNSATSRNCWGDYNIDTDYYSTTPDTGVTVSVYLISRYLTQQYVLTVDNTTLAPDGVSRQMLVFNGTYPGPTIEANWGDTINITVINNLQNNGYELICL